MNFNIPSFARSGRLVLAAAAAAIALAGCSLGDTFDGVAVELIENDLSELLVIDLTEASCEEPGDESVGSTFTCTAATPGGETAEFLATIQTEDSIEVVPTNVFGPEDFDLVEGDAPTVLTRDLGIDVESVECPDEGVVLVDQATTCRVTSTDGVSGELIVSFDAEAQQLLYDIGEIDS